MNPGDDPVGRLLAIDDAELDRAWADLASWWQARFARDLSVESALFLVGIQSRGRGFTDRLRKEEKQDLIMEGTWVVFSAVGIANLDELRGTWERAAPMPVMSVSAQEKLLRSALVRYFTGALDRGPETATVR